MRFADRIDPELRGGLAFYEMLGLAQHQKLEGDTITALRRRGTEMLAAVLATLPHDERVRTEDRTIDRAGVEVPVRLYRPVDADGSLPALVWMHGGGMMFGDVEASGMACERYAAEVGCVIVSVNYRLAPEHPYPAAIEDCYAAAAWTAEHADEIGIDVTRIAVGGESAGGGLAAGTALLARDKGGPRLALQVLAYPMLDDRNDTPSASEFDDIPSWSSRHNDGAWRALLGDRGGTDMVEPYAAPARATDLSGLPPALIQVGELDTFRDEDIDYAARLLRAGVPTELHVYPGAYHAWDVAVPGARQAMQAFDERIAALRRALMTGPAEADISS